MCAGLKRFRIGSSGAERIDRLSDYQLLKNDCSIISHIHCTEHGSVTPVGATSQYFPRTEKNQEWCPVLGYGLDDWGSRVRFPVGAGNFSLHHRVQNGSGTHSASYPMGTRGSFPASKAAGVEADHSPPSSAEVKECVELYLHFPNTPSWCGAQFKKKHRDNFPFCLLSNRLLCWMSPLS
jgi:hypothetical protein